ncbi:PREDICTED: CSC1-like protein RXW8 isoform X2 [Ipomoea nil]|uniref:CSC1-like protein RXW8 isoform X2 n=1 Tax=Ipomoea nil TaxID=35883 RepID=UPI000901AEAB|nr:PREDICTED: CSC1-like protein RXW8 isoform X2 [Ipomoea nil]
MNLSALLTSAGMNTVVCVVCFILYSVLRKQPSLVSVYFGQKLAHLGPKRPDPLCFERFVPSPSWFMKAWETTDEEINAVGGLDALVFDRTIVFSIRIFSIAASICLFLVLPLNYFGQDVAHELAPEDSLEIFTIENVKEGSQWLWAHCLALYEYKYITKMRLAYISSSVSNPCYFTVLVRGIPRSEEESYSELVAKFFTSYYASSYLTHQIIYRSGVVQRLVTDAEKFYRMLKSTPQRHGSLLRCGICGGTSASFRILTSDCSESDQESTDLFSDFRDQECAAALVFFRTRYAASVASQGIKSPNPMLWVTDLAPEPRDMYWSNICVPYRLLWIRKIIILVASFFFVAFFLVPVSLTQGLVHLDKLQHAFPFLKGPLKGKLVVELVTGYLPSVVLILFSYMVPPIMIFFSTMEGSISRSDRKKSACIKILYFMIWNVFFAQTISGSVIDGWSAIAKLGKNLKDLPNLLATAVPTTAAFFNTYVMTSGWASLSCELMQPFGILCNLFYRYILLNKDESTYGTMTFPYHTEYPRVLLLALLGYTCSILAPLILIPLLVYFALAYIIYRNQILNVYVTKYQTGGLYWIIVHKATIFSLVLTQIIALGVFGLKKSTVASGFTFPLIICTLLFNEYCRQRFHPVFRNLPAQILVDMDRKDEQEERMKDIYQKVTSAYCQFRRSSVTLGSPHPLNPKEQSMLQELEDDVNPAALKPDMPAGSWNGHTNLEIEEVGK